MEIKRVIHYFFLILTVCYLFSCNNERKISNREYDKEIEEIRIGYTNRTALPRDLHSMELRRLLEYQESNNVTKRIGRDQLIIDSSLIHLYLHEYINSFESLKEYIALTGKRGYVYYNIALVYNQINDREEKKIARKALFEVKDGNFTPTKEQSLQLLSQVGPDYLTINNAPPYIKESDDYITAIQLLQNSRNNLLTGEKIKHRVDLMINPQFFDNKNIDLIENLESKTSFHIDFLISYYLSDIKQDFYKASYWADEREPIVEQKDPYLPMIRIENMMKTYIGTERYDDAIDFFEMNKFQITEQDMRESEFYILLAACYAGKHDIDNALKYLNKEIAVTEIYDYIKNQPPLHEQRNRHMAISLSGVISIPHFRTH